MLFGSLLSIYIHCLPVCINCFKNTLNGTFEMIDKRLQLTRKQQNHGFLVDTLKSSRSPPCIGQPLQSHKYAPLVVITIRSFPDSCLIIRFVPGIILQVPNAWSRNWSPFRSTTFFSGFALIDLLCFMRWIGYPCLSFYPFSFGHCFWLPVLSSLSSTFSY